MTPVYNHILRHTYNDSVVLMEISAILERLPGINKAAVVMGSPAGIDILQESELLSHDMTVIDEDDMVIAVSAEDKSAAEKAFLHTLEQMKGGKLQKNSDPGLQPDRLVGTRSWREIPEAVRLAVISVPGQYAAAEAWRVLKANRHVLLFSDHVSLEDEIALKQAGVERNLLVMGPECGTAILGGIPLGFANRVRRGKVGVVAASGSGLQELTCLIDKLGGGISHAIGTGGRDLSREVGGLTASMGIQLLHEDPQTEIICVLSKPPHPKVAQEMLRKAINTGKPVVACFIGVHDDMDMSGVTITRTIEEAALACMEIVQGTPKQPFVPPEIEITEIKQSGSILGLFSGGTLAYEAMQILRKAVGTVYSNVPLSPEEMVTNDPITSHTCLDLGAEEYTLGRPHPMIDGRFRADMVASSGENEHISIVLLDVILGTGSDPDPAGILAEGVIRSREASQKIGHEQIFIASVTGTEMDMQNYSQQVSKLRALGVIVAPTNASAARLAGELITK